MGVIIGKRSRGRPATRSKCCGRSRARSEIEEERKDDRPKQSLQARTPTEGALFLGGGLASLPLPHVRERLWGESSGWGISSENPSRRSLSGFGQRLASKVNSTLTLDPPFSPPAETVTSWERTMGFSCS